MSSVSTLTYPKKSHRKEITIPPDSEKLAEFFGIMMGDGGINNPWQATISLNSIADKTYSEYVSRLSIELFAIVPAIRTRKTSNTLLISIASTTLVDFLVTKGISRGNKLLQDLHIPAWILGNEAYVRACVRGLVDTDGCLFIHKHKVSGNEYRNIGLTFTSYSPYLLGQVAAIFEQFGIVPHITKRGTEIYLYRQADVERYLAIFETSNERISSVYENWRGARVV